MGLFRRFFGGRVFSASRAKTAELRLKRASLTVARFSASPVSAVARADLLAAAKELEAAGEAEKAAQAYALASDSEGEARALIQAGDVDGLETLLSKEREEEQADRQRRRAYGKIEALVASGRRREALWAAERLAAASPADTAAREQIHRLRARRLSGPISRVAIGGKPLHLVWGDEVIVGRTEGALLIRSSVMSRKHLSIARVDGKVVLRDLASRNGTLLSGVKIAGDVPVGDRLEVRLGGEVTLRVAPCAVFERAVEIHVGGERYVAPLGMARLNIGEWRLEPGTDGWIELATNDRPSAYLGPLALAPATTLLTGDAIAASRGGETALEILGIG